MSLVSQQQIVILSQPESRTRDEGESKDPDGMSPAMQPQGVLSMLLRENALRRYFMPHAFSGSFDFAPIRMVREKTRWRFAQDDRRRVACFPTALRSCAQIAAIACFSLTLSASPLFAETNQNTPPAQPTQEAAPPALPQASPAATPQPSPSPAAPQPADAPVPRAASDDEIVITAVGDVMLGTTFPDASGGDLPPNDGADLLQEVTPFLKRGDVVFGNLEGPLADGGTSAKCSGKRLGTCYAFRVPTRYGKYLKSAGFTVMGLANNHAMDFGAEGRASSRQVLDSFEIAHSGEIGDIAHLVVKGIKVDVIAFATYPGAYNLLDLDEALQAIRAAKAEADLVIVSFHGGAEGASHQHVLAGDETFLGEDRGDLRRFTHAAVDAGAQLVLGSGPHVVRAMEVYHGKLIAYSLGNFATYGPFNLNGENGVSMVLEAHLSAGGSFIRGQVYPVKQEKPGGPKLDPAMKIIPILRALSTSDFKQDAIVVGPRGELYLPGTEVPECSNAPDLLEQPVGARPCGVFP